MTARSSLVVCGWDADARRALDALAATGAFEAATVLDRSGVALVDARRATGGACSQLVGQTLDAGGYDAVLLASSEHVAVDAARAARQGAALILLAGAASGAALQGAIEATQAFDVPLHLMRPALHDPGIADLLRAVEARDWRPRTLDITIEAATEVSYLLSLAVAFATRLVDDIPDGITISAAGSTRLAAVTVETDSCFASLRVRHAPTAFARIAGEGIGGAFDLRIEAGTGHLALAPDAGMPSARVRPAADGWAIEAQRIAAGGGDDLTAATHEATLLSAIDAARMPRTETAAPAPRPRPALTLVRGAVERTASPGRRSASRALHLVGSP